MPRAKKTKTATKPAKKKKPRKGAKTTEKKVFKKRGRKPKGGKIISKTELKSVQETIDVPNIILHLKCSSKDLAANTNMLGCGLNSVSPFSILNWKDINEKTEQRLPSPPPSEDLDPPNKIIWNKLKMLEKKLHTNDVLDKKSCCFWCSCPFNNPPIYIPRQERNNIIEVYGCFCTPECACAFLNREHIDSSSFWERYALLNNIYGKIYNYERSVKPAPDPFHTLDKYYGNLTIQEYRKLLKNDRILMVVEKPLTKILPELHDEKNEMPNIHTNLLNGKSMQGVHYRLKRNEPKYSKSNILNSTFNLK